MSERSQAADLIKKILDERGWSQTALAELTGVDRSLINNYVTGKRDPGPLTCVFLAALSSTQTDRSFWMRLSGLTGRQLELIAEALEKPAPTIQPGEESQLIEWWREPHNIVEKSAKDFIEQLLKVRTRET